VTTLIKFTLESLTQFGALVSLAAFILVFTDFAMIHWLGLAEKFPRLIWIHFIQTWIFCYLLSLCFSKKTFFIWNAILFSFSFLQWLCLSYYGSYLSPMMIFLFFRDIAEVIESSKGAGQQLVKPIVMGFLGVILLRWLTLLKYEKNISGLSLISKRVLKVLIFFTILYPIPRTFFTGHTFGKQAKVQELSLVNFYGAFSYFFGRILPAKAKAAIMSNSNEKSNFNEKLVPRSIVELNPQRHVVFILGESLGLRHLQLFGYHEETTPQLLSLYQQNKLLIRSGVSGGVSTDVSIPMLIQDAFGPSAASMVASQEHCLFKLAKKNGFQTSFISVQTQENLQHITNFFCNTYLDFYKAGDNSNTINGESTALDEELLAEAKKISWKQPQFVIFHQRGSHSPYESRYPSNHAFRVINKNDPWELQLKKHYDNSVHYTDQNIKDLVEWIQMNSTLPVEVIFTSDHGEALGETQQWGHVILHPVVAEVPVLYFPENETFRAVFKKQKNWVNHHFVSSFLISLLGYGLESSFEDGTNQILNQNHFVMGADLDGLGGFMKVIPHENELVRLPE